VAVLDDAPRASGLGRLLGVRGDARAAGVALLLGGVGVGAFVGSLVLDWYAVSFNVLSVGPSPSGTTFGLSDDMFGQVYLLGVLGLIALLGGVLSRPETAARLRMAAAGWAVGVGSVVLAIALHLRHEAQSLSQSSYYVPDSSGTFTVVGDVNATVHTSTQFRPGIYLAFAALVLLTAGVFAAAQPAVKALKASPAPGPAQERSPEAPAVREQESEPRGGAQQAVRVDDLTVIAGHSTTSLDADILRN